MGQANFASSRLGAAAGHFASSRMGGNQQQTFGLSRPFIPAPPPMTKLLHGASAFNLDQNFANMSMRDEGLPQMMYVDDQQRPQQPMMQMPRIADYSPLPTNYGCFLDRCKF